jgi:hypothetical protein
MLAPLLARPADHLGLDPEFGSFIGATELLKQGGMAPAELHPMRAVRGAPVADQSEIQPWRHGGVPGERPAEHGLPFGGGAPCAP